MKIKCCLQLCQFDIFLINFQISSSRRIHDRHAAGEFQELFNFWKQHIIKTMYRYDFINFAYTFYIYF